jgi:hypothetical protein
MKPASHIRPANIKFTLILFLAVVLTVISCSNDASHKETVKTSGPGRIHNESTLRVVIRWPGDDFASRQDIETRNKIQDLMVERNVGKVVRVGTGMGWMDIIVEVRDKKAARSSISDIMRIVAPERKYTIE